MRFDNRHCINVFHKKGVVWHCISSEYSVKSQQQQNDLTLYPQNPWPIQCQITIHARDTVAITRNNKSAKMQCQSAFWRAQYRVKSPSTLDLKQATEDASMARRAISRKSSVFLAFSAPYGMPQRCPTSQIRLPLLQVSPKPRPMRVPLVLGLA